MNHLFKAKFNAACVVLIPACIGINYLGKLFASVLKLPLWLDSIGTCIGAVLGGPIIGAVCGAANNLIYGFTTGDTITLVYALTSLGIGVAVGIMARLGQMEKLPGAILSACVAGLTAVAWSQASRMPVFLGSLLDEVVVDVPDKLITILVVYAIVKGLPGKLTSMYDVDNKVERLD